MSLSPIVSIIRDFLDMEISDRLKFAKSELTDMFSDLEGTFLISTLRVFFFRGNVGTVSFFAEGFAVDLAVEAEVGLDNLRADARNDDLTTSESSVFFVFVVFLSLFVGLIYTKHKHKEIHDRAKLRKHIKPDHIQPKFSRERKRKQKKDT